MKKLSAFILGLLLAVPVAGMADVLRTVQAGSTDVSVDLKIIDSTDGTPETGVVFNTSGIDLEYCRDKAACVDITEADLTTPALTDAHEDGGFLAKGHGNYRLDLPDAAVAVGVDFVTIQGTVTDMIVLGGIVELVAYDPHDSTRLGLASLPNAAADAAGGLPVSDAGGLDLDDIPLNAELNARTLLAADYFDPSADTVANVTTVATLTGHTAQTGDNFARLGAPVGASLSADVAAVKADTDATLTDTADMQPKLGTYSDLGSGATLSGNLEDMRDDGTAVFDRSTDSLQAIADSGGGGPTAAQIVDEWETQSQADPTGFHVNVMEVNGTAQGATDIDARLDGIEGATFSSATDSLEAIRDRGDAAWTTGSGTGLSPIATGTAQSATGTTLVLASGETFDDDELRGAVVQVTGGSTGVGQSRCITDNVGSTDTITVSTWTTTPTGTITYEIAPSLGGECPLSTASSGATELNLTASGNIGIDLANVENPTTTLALPNVTVGTVTTNTDMRGTDSALLASSVPTNFGSMQITAGGAVDSLVQGFLDSTIAETTADRIAGNFEVFWDNADALTTNTVDDVGAGAGGSFWSTTEQNEIRGRLGITGTTAAGGNTPTLALEASLFDPSTDAVANVTTVGSVSGAVGSVTGNVGGNVTGSVGSVLGSINTSGGTITTLDALDTAQDSQHGTTQALIAALPTATEIRSVRLCVGQRYDVRAVRVCFCGLPVRRVRLHGREPEYRRLLGS